MRPGRELRVCLTAPALDAQVGDVYPAVAHRARDIDGGAPVKPLRVIGSQPGPAPESFGSVKTNACGSEVNASERGPGAPDGRDQHERPGSWERVFVRHDCAVAARATTDEDATAITPVPGRLGARTA
jgi:hypothetical protein